MAGERTLGFIGLGVMGEPMCRHLVERSGSPVTVFDIDPEPLARIVTAGATAARSVAEVAAADTVFLSLPSGTHLEQVCRGADGLLARTRPGQTIVDLSTSPLTLTRELAADFEAEGAAYADAPVARTRAAAEAGTLAVTVGGSDEVFRHVEPLLRCFASEVTHCGPVGAGQVVKILNNMVLVGTVTALSEAAAIAETAGIERAALFEALSKGSADSFALRNHGLKAIAANDFPERAFSADYMAKDISYALAMAESGGVEARAAKLGATLLAEASQAGFGDAYWPVIVKVIEGRRA